MFKSSYSVFRHLWKHLKPSKSQQYSTICSLWTMHQIILHDFTSGRCKVAPHNTVPRGTSVPRGIAWCIILKLMTSIVMQCRLYLKIVWHVQQRVKHTCMWSACNILWWLLQSYISGCVFIFLPNRRGRISWMTSTHWELTSPSSSRTSRGSRTWLTRYKKTRGSSAIGSTNSLQMVGFLSCLWSRWETYSILPYFGKTDTSDISCKRAKCVCHFRRHQYIHLLAGWVLIKCKQFGLE